MSQYTCSVATCDTDMSGKYLRKGYCDKHYYSWRKYGTPTPSKEQRSAKRARRVLRLVKVVCFHCNRTFEAATRSKRFCSIHCTTWSKYLGPGGSKYCSECGSPMVVSRPSGDRRDRCKECSEHGSGGYDAGCRCDVCITAKREANMAYKARVKAEHGVNPSTLYKRRYRERTGIRYRMAPKDWISPEIRLELHERDGWVCHLCGELTDRNAHFNDDIYPSLDHILARSLGGTDGPENLATAHRICNSVRGVAPIVGLEVA